MVRLYPSNRIRSTVYVSVMLLAALVSVAMALVLVVGLRRETVRPSPVGLIPAACASVDPVRFPCPEVLR